jgi:hypothetical protein
MQNSPAPATYRYRTEAVRAFMQAAFPRRQIWHGSVSRRSAISATRALRHKTGRQAYVLAVRATERAYLDLPVYGSGIVAGHGRTEIARCEIR